MRKFSTVLQAYQYKATDQKNAWCILKKEEIHRFRACNQHAIAL